MTENASPKIFEVVFIRESETVVTKTPKLTYEEALARFSLVEMFHSLPNRSSQPHFHYDLYLLKDGEDIPIKHLHINPEV